MTTGRINISEEALISQPWQQKVQGCGDGAESLVRAHVGGLRLMHLCCYQHPVQTDQWGMDIPAFPGVGTRWRSSQERCLFKRRVPGLEPSPCNPGCGDTAQHKDKHIAT